MKGYVRRLVFAGASAVIPLAAAVPVAFAADAPAASTSTKRAADNDSRERWGPGMMEGEHGVGPGMMGAYRGGPGPGMGGGYQGGYRGYQGGGPGMMGGYYGGMGPGMMGGYYGGMGPGMMGGYYGGMGPGMMGGYGGMGPGMMGGFHGGMMGGGCGPALGALDLSSDQVSKIQKICDDVRKQHWDLAGKMMDEHARMRDLSTADQRDTAAIVKEYANLQAMQRQMLEQSLNAESRIEGVLNKDQLAQYRNMQRWGGY